MQMNKGLMVFIQQFSYMITSLKMGICNEFWSVKASRYSFESLIWNGNIVTNFENFLVESFFKEIKKFVDDKNIVTNIYRTESYDSILCGYY